MEIARRFGANLAKARERAGVSQEELGIRASLHRTQVGSLERGDHLARIDTLAKLAGALGVPPGELLDGIAWRPGHALAGGWQESNSRPEETRAATRSSRT
ncbi:MAG TPA: helix-turn-helix transcriptional regulator [Solirubrobacterales bacterium]